MNRALLLCLLAAPAVASAQPYRLRADALADVRPPAGLVVLSGEGQPASFVCAEAVIWAGTIDEEGPGDALVALVSLRDPTGHGELRAGRLVVATGAVRPVHVDGADVRTRLPAGLGLEVFGGLPVVPELGPRAFDWLVGGRASETVEGTLTTGVSYLHRRDRGRRADEELGADIAATPTRWLDLASYAAYDLVSPGIAEARMSAAARSRALRAEAWATRRSPSRILQATSIWSALGDVPSDQIGVTLSWRAAPRLDLDLSPSARFAGPDAGLDASARAVLRLDDRGDGAVLGEARRAELADAAWSGVRTGLRVPLVERISLATELELAFPDEPRGRGSVWPWGLVGLAWRFARDWEAAAAFEASASPDRVAQATALARLGSRWEIQ